jgi:hypothetical protein
MINGRVRQEPSWPQGGIVSRPMPDHTYEVQQFTGRPIANNPRGRWSRGSVARFGAPAFHPNVGPLFMNDPTDPVRYVTVISSQRKRGLVRAQR